MPEEEFCGVMKMCDEFGILLLEEGFLDKVISLLESHPLITKNDLTRIQGKGALDEVNGLKAVAQELGIPLRDFKEEETVGVQVPEGVVVKEYLIAKGRPFTLVMGQDLDPKKDYPPNTLAMGKCTRALKGKPNVTYIGGCPPASRKFMERVREKLGCSDEPVWPPPFDEE